MVHDILQGGWFWINDILLCLQVYKQVQAWPVAHTLQGFMHMFGIAVGVSWH